MQRRDDLNNEVDEEVLRIQDLFDPDLIELTQEEIKPRKSDINVERVVLVWLPYTMDSTNDRRGTQRAF
jgi:hypothetical protein